MTEFLVLIETPVGSFSISPNHGGSKTAIQFFSRNASADRQLVLNFAPIHLEDAEIIVGIAPYKDKDYLRSLRKQYSDTHLFHREKNQILSVAIAPEAQIVGETSELIELLEDRAKL